MKPNQIICGNNIEVVKSWPPNCVDAICTDPPYGLSFMGKDWDKLDKIGKRRGQTMDDAARRGMNPSALIKTPGFDYSNKAMQAQQQWHYQWAKAMLRITKPGGFLLCFGGTRTYHRLACAIEDAGWEIRDDIATFIGSDWKLQAFYESLNDEQKGAFEELFLPSDVLAWAYGSGFPKSHNISMVFEKRLCEKREIDGQKKWFYKNTNEEMRKEPSFKHPLANKYFGIGTALKPAWEPIIVAMKPLDGTFAHNAETHGVAGLNIDGGRIGSNPGYKYNADKNGTTFHGQQGERIKQTAEKKGDQFIESTQGRWPANLILECICDEIVETDKTVGRESGYDFELGNQNNPARNITNIKSGIHYKDKVRVHTNPDCPCTMLDEQSGTKKSGFMAAGTKRQMSDNPNKNTYGKFNPDTVRNDTYGDCGGASRFFYCAKTSRKERNMGMEDSSGKKVNDGRQTPIDNPYQRGETIRKNTHPTVKPLALMKYLCTLLKMPSAEQVILDPFLGSGTTGMACRELGINFVGIEKEPEYCEIAVHRIAAVEGIHPVVLLTDNPPTEVPKSNPNDRRYGTTPITAKMLSDEKHRQSIINAASAGLRRNRK